MAWPFKSKKTRYTRYDDIVYIDKKVGNKWKTTNSMDYGDFYRKTGKKVKDQYKRRGWF